MKKIKYLIKKSFIGTIYLVIYRLLTSEININGVISKTLPVTYLRDNKNAVFFGYHDKTPFSSDNNKILAMSVPASDKKAESECSYMKIGYFLNINNHIRNQFIQISDTNTWCWQQGCMLQWNPKKPNNEVIFNRIVDGIYGSVIFDITKESIIKEYSVPIYSVSNDGSFATSLNFSRLGRLRPGYGYCLLNDKTKCNYAPKNDGLFLLDLNSGNIGLLVSLHELAEQVGKMDCEHYINHISISPDNKVIVFFHLWVDENNNRHNRFMIYDIKNKKISTIEDKIRVSHFCWIDNNCLLVTIKEKNEKHWKYVSYNIDKHVKMSEKDIPLKTDGHPMISPIDKSLFVTDSRLNKRREDSILICSLNTKNVYKVAKFIHKYGYDGQVRCDLHPRWDRFGKHIAVDIVNKGKRAMAIIDVHSTVEKNQN